MCLLSRCHLYLLSSHQSLSCRHIKHEAFIDCRLSQFRETEAFKSSRKQTVSLWPKPKTWRKDRRVLVGTGRVTSVPMKNIWLYSSPIHRGNIHRDETASWKHRQDVPTTSGSCFSAVVGLMSRPLVFQVWKMVSAPRPPSRVISHRFQWNRLHWKKNTISEYICISGSVENKNEEQQWKWKPSVWHLKTTKWWNAPPGPPCWAWTHLNMYSVYFSSCSDQLNIFRRFCCRNMWRVFSQFSGVKDKLINDTQWN